MENIRRWFENDKINNGQDYEIYEYEGHLEARTDTVIFMVVEPHSGTKIDGCLEFQRKVLLTDGLIPQPL